MSYDALPYPSLPLSQTHPERLATQATLLGLTPVPVERCRVLELGCASGGNLLPMATLLPESHFVGIDLSPRQIEAGQAIVAELQLSNLELRALDISKLAQDETLGAALGQFEGVEPRVAADVQAGPAVEILGNVRRDLLPRGVGEITEPVVGIGLGSIGQVQVVEPRTECPRALSDLVHGEVGDRIDHAVSPGLA